jgi:hypothetical protein
MWAAVALASALIATWLPTGVDTTPAVSAAIPAGLPSTFGFGLAAGQGDTWMPQSGIPWSYRYQYLVGGVNTGAGWETWNAPRGTFATNYARESNQHGYVPMFPYYELLQSNGTCGSCPENQRDITNLNTPSIMSAYFENFALLMKRLGPGTYDGVVGYGKTVLVNVEPDFAGGYAYQAVNNGACFGYCTQVGNDPAFLKASVASSGYPPVAAYANTWAGATQALAHLRDLYAPNVLLGYEASPWATGTDIGVDTRAGIDAVGLGRQVGTFLARSGAHQVLFNDPLDRDAGQYATQFRQKRWWDRTNVTFPNFTRWEHYLKGAITADGNRAMLLWQVPNGNQYFATVNNTNGHYQDNRPEYIFSHVSELIQVGVVGVMFGAGNAGNTTYNDSTEDGITNPPSFCTTDGLSSGQICNDHVSTVPDDDGGYIRMQAQVYYRSPIALTTPATSTSTPSVPQPAYATGAVASATSVARGDSVSITATVRSAAASAVLVDIEVYNGANAKIFQKVFDHQTFSAGQTRSFATSWSVPTNASVGPYSVRIGVFSPGWGTVYSWNGSAAGFSVE